MLKFETTIGEIKKNWTGYQVGLEGKAKICGEYYDVYFSEHTMEMTNIDKVAPVQYMDLQDLTDATVIELAFEDVVIVRKR